MESILRTPDHICVQEGAREWHKAMTIIDSAAVSGDVSVEARLTNSNTLAIHVTADTTPVKLIKLRWNFRKVLGGDIKILGDDWERGYGTLGWKGLEPYRHMPWYFLVEETNGKFNTMTGCGVKVRPGALCFWQLDPMGLTLWLDVRCGGDGVILGGRTLCACEVVFRMYSNVSAYTFGRSFCKDMCPDPVFPEAPVYGSNNWYYAYGESSREEILEDTKLLASLTEGLNNRPYMVIDDCWQYFRCPEYIGGPWTPNKKFGDMASLASEISEMGCKPGLWVRFLLERSAEIPDSWKLYGTSKGVGMNLNARLNSEALENKETPWSRYGADKESFVLDPSVPEVLEHIKEDIRRVCGWGYKLIKHDFTTFDLFGKWGFQMQPLMTADGWHFADQSRTSAEIVVSLYQAIWDAASEFGAVVIGCNTIGHLGAGLMQVSRTGDDTSGKLWETSWRMGANTLAFRQIQHGTFFDCDADCVGVTTRIPWSLNRYWAGLLANSGTVFFASLEPEAVTEENEPELKEFFAQASEQKYVAEPIDWQSNNMPQHWRTSTEIPGQTRDLFFNWYESTGMRLPVDHSISLNRLDPEKFFNE